MGVRFAAFRALALLTALAATGCAHTSDVRRSPPSTPMPPIPTASIVPLVRHQGLPVVVVATPAVTAAPPVARVVGPSALAPSAMPRVSIKTAVPVARTPRPTPIGQLAARAAVTPAPARLQPTRVLPPKVPIAQPHDRPRIILAQVNPTTVRSGDVVHGRVLTTSNVASVEAKIEGISAGLQRRDVGDFSLDYTVPEIPFWFRPMMRSSYTLHIIARNVDGIQATRDVEITVR